MKRFFIPKITNFKNWNEIEKLNDFSYPWLKERSPKTEFRAYYDEKHLHFRFDAWGPQPLIFVNNNNKLEVTQSERVEIFFRSNEKMHPYYVLEIDPHGRVLDYKANLYRDFDRNWHWPENLFIQTKIKKENYYVKGKISLSILNQLDLLKNNQIQAGLYRGHCTKIIDEKASIKWISWIDPKTQEPDFHVSSSFGCFYFE